MRCSPSRPRWIWSLAAVALTAPLSARGQVVVVEERPFASGETLEYSVSFGPFRVQGTGQLRVEGTSRRAGEDAVLLSFDVEAVIAGQRVSHHARSWLSTARFASLAYEMEEQSPLGKGATRWEWPGHTEPGTTALPLDELSFIYLLRTLSLPADTTLRLDRHYDPTRNPVQVRVLRREVTALLGVPLQTVLVELRVRDPQRFKGGEGVLRMHFTDDSARIPVRLQIASPLGPELVLELRALPSKVARR